MSIEAMSLVLHHSQATGRAKLVLLGIANHLGDEGAWPAIETLARYANASPRSVQRDIKELADMGELIIAEQGSPISSQYRTNLYWINVTCPENCDGTYSHRTGVTDRAPGVTNTAPGVTTGAPGVTDQAFRGDNCVVQNVINPINRQRTKTMDSDEEFKAFWSVYPKSAEKDAAYKAWVKRIAAKVDPQDIIDGATRYAQDPNRVPQFTKNPATWLNAGCWTDDPLPARELTKEQIEDRAREKARMEREAELERSRRMRDEMDQQKAKAAPMPDCEHGKPLLRCLPCMKRLAEKENNP